MPEPVAATELSVTPETPGQEIDGPLAVESVPPVAVDPLSNVFEGDENAPEPVSPGTEDLTDLDWARDELAQDRAAAADGAPSSLESGDCLRGYCPVALRDERRLAKGLDEYATEFQAQNYRFSSAEARDRFLEHPEWYVPAAGGLDILEVRRGQDVTSGSLDHACWFRHRLHMFSTEENLAAFRAAPRDFVTAP